MSRHGRSPAFPSVRGCEQKVRKIILEEFIPENAIFVDPIRENPYNNITELINASTLSNADRHRARDMYIKFMDSRLFNWKVVLLLTYHDETVTTDEWVMKNETPINAFKSVNDTVMQRIKENESILGYGFVLYPGGVVLHELSSIKGYFLQQGIGDEDAMMRARLREVLDNLPAYLTF